MAVGFASVGKSSMTGEIGDTFGIVSALFTMFAMLGAALAVYYQHTELVESREREREAKLQREAEQREQRFFVLLQLAKDATKQSILAESL